MLQAMRLVVLALILPASAKTGGSCALQTKAATKKGASQKSLENQTEGGRYHAAVMVIVCAFFLFEVLNATWCLLAQTH